MILCIIPLNWEISHQRAAGERDELEVPLSAEPLSVLRPLIPRHVRGGQDPESLWWRGDWRSSTSCARATQDSWWHLLLHRPGQSQSPFLLPLTPFSSECLLYHQEAAELRERDRVVRVCPCLQKDERDSEAAGGRGGRLQHDYQRQFWVREIELQILKSEYSNIQIFISHFSHLPLGLDRTWP